MRLEHEQSVYITLSFCHPHHPWYITMYSLFVSVVILTIYATTTQDMSHYASLLPLENGVLRSMYAFSSEIFFSGEVQLPQMTEESRPMVI